MKAYFWLPFACLAGLLVGMWGPRAEIRAMKALAHPSLPLANLKISIPTKPACVFRLRAS